MEYNYRYKNLADRRLKVAEAEGLSYRMLHDDFDPSWKRGDEPHGVMIFTDAIEPDPEPPRDLAAEVDSLKAEIETLKNK